MIVTNITSRPVTTRFGPKPVYDVHLDGVKHSFGFTKPPFAIGADIDCMVNSDKYGPKIEPASVVVKAHGTPGTTPSPSAPPSPVSGPSSGTGRYSGPPAKVFPIPLLHGDRAIVRQNSVTNAVKLAADGGYLAGLRPSEAASTVIDIARMFEAYSCGDLESEAADKLVEAGE